MLPYPKWLTELDKLDTEVTRKFRHDEFWYILEIGGVFMSCAPGWYLVNLFYVVFLFSVMGYYVPCLIVSMFKVDDLAEMGQYLNFMSLILIAQSMIITGNMKRRDILRISNISAERFYDYGNTLDLSAIEKSEKVFRTLKKVLLVVLPTWLVLIAGSVMVRELVDDVFQYHSNVNETFVNGVYQRLPLKMWYFHTIDAEYKRYIFIVSQIICSTEMAMAICSADLLLIFLGQKLIVQMQTLVIAIRDTDVRANNLYNATFGKKPPEDGLARRNDPNLMDIYEKCLKQTLEHHYIIMEYAESFREILNWPSGVSVLNGSILVAMSSISLMQGGGQPSLIVTSVLLIIAEVVSLLILCEIGQMVKELSEEFFDTMYTFRWMDCSEKVQKIIRLMKSGMANPIVLVAGKLTALNRDTFATIMQSAYTYMNLMRASSGEE